MSSSTKTPMARLRAKPYTLIRVFQIPELMYCMTENEPLIPMRHVNRSCLEMIMSLSRPSWRRFIYGRCL